MQIIHNENRNEILYKTELIIKLTSIISTICLISFAIDKVFIESISPGFKRELKKINISNNIFELFKENNNNRTSNFSNEYFCESLLNDNELLIAKIDLENYDRDKKITEYSSLIILILSATLFGSVLIQIKIKSFHNFQKADLILCPLLSITVFIKIVLSFSLYMKSFHIFDFFEVLNSSKCFKKEKLFFYDLVRTVFLPKIKVINYSVLFAIVVDFVNLMILLHLLKNLLIYNLNSSEYSSVEENEYIQPIEMQIRQEDDLLYKIKNVNL
jgi:hypothetical protein